MKSPIINEKKHKENLEDLGRFGAHLLMYFITLFVAVWTNFEYTPSLPWFLVVLIAGAVVLVPRAIKLTKRFEENRRDG